MIIFIMRNPERRSFPLSLIPANVFFGWWLLVLGSLILAVGSGVLYHGFTVFFLPLKRDLALSSASVSLLYGAARLEGGMEGPLIGYLIDRFGPRVVIIGGAATAGIGLIILSTVNSFLSFFFVYIFIVSLGYNAGFFHPVYALVNSWFIRHRGFGFAAVGAASSIGGMIMAPFLSYLILNFGWRVGAVIGGLLIMGVAIPAAIPIYRCPEKIGLQPDGRPPQDPKDQEEGTPTNRLDPADFSVREALHTLNYWLLFSAISLRILVTVALIIHFVPLLAWKGMSEAAAAYLVSLFAFCSIGTTLATGWLGDRWSKALLCSLGVLPTVVAMSVLILSQPGDALFAFPIGLAVTAGTIPLNWALIGDLFGRRSYATLRGIMAVGYGIATFASPIYAGWVFDRTGSYQKALFSFIVAQTLGALLFGVLYLRSRRGGKIGKEAAV